MKRTIREQLLSIGDFLKAEMLMGKFEISKIEIGYETTIVVKVHEVELRLIWSDSLFMCFGELHISNFSLEEVEAMKSNLMPAVKEAKKKKIEEEIQKLNNL